VRSALRRIRLACLLNNDNDAGPVPPIRRQSLSEQTAAHLREAMRAGRWQEGLPGVRRLAADLGVSRDTLRAAMRLLEADGQIQAPGHGRRRQVVGRDRTERRAIRVGVLLQFPLSEQNSEMQRTLAMLQHDIEVAGHIWIVAEKAHCELDDDFHRLSRLFRTIRADAWIVISPSRSLLLWFSQQAIPTIAFGGASMEFPVAGAGVDIVPPVRKAVQRLTSLGHRRIVLIAPPHWRHPTPSRTLQAYLDELTFQNISPNEYHAPAWEQSGAA